MHKAILLLRKIPKGMVTTYKILAEKCGTSPRAIGRIMANNKEPERYPCYKVVHADGSVGNYSAKGGRGKKAELLKRDGVEILNGKISRKYFWRFS